MARSRNGRRTRHAARSSLGDIADTETADPLEFLVRVLVHIPDRGHVTTRYDGWYANRPRGSPFGHAAEGGAHNRGRAARDRPRTMAGADRVHPLMGEGPTAAIAPYTRPTPIETPTPTSRSKATGWANVSVSRSPSTRRLVGWRR